MKNKIIAFEDNICLCVKVGLNKEKMKKHDYI